LLLTLPQTDADRDNGATIQGMSRSRGCGERAAHRINARSVMRRRQVRTERRLFTYTSLIQALCRMATSGQCAKMTGIMPIKPVNIG
jgi:hypothetical protein